MEDLASAIRAELHSACSHLLDPGIERAARLEASQRSAPLPAGPLGQVLSVARALQRTVPAALGTAEFDPTAALEELTYKRHAKAARPSLSARDYAVCEGAGAGGASRRLVPLSWRSREPRIEHSPELLGWLQGGLDELLSRLEEHLRLLQGQLSESRAFRSGSRFGDEDVAQLQGRQTQLLGAIESSRALRRAVAGALGREVRPRAQAPRPFPRLPAWARVRRAITELRNPGSALPSIAAGMLAEEGLDLPFLYQRWCGWKLIETLRELGHIPESDPISALLLSGLVSFRTVDQGSGSLTLSVLVDPRLAPGKEALLGLRSPRAEVTPDLLIVARHDSHVRAFVLDPTLTRDKHAIAERKGKYLSTIECGQATVAGVRVLRGVDRSWAAAPLDDQVNYVHAGDWRGTRGVVPMNPLDWKVGPLKSWIADLLTPPALPA